MDPPPQNLGTPATMQIPSHLPSLCNPTFITHFISSSFFSFSCPLCRSPCLYPLYPTSSLRPSYLSAFMDHFCPFSIIFDFTPHYCRAALSVPSPVSCTPKAHASPLSPQRPLNAPFVTARRPLVIFTG